MYTSVSITLQKAAWLMAAVAIVALSCAAQSPSLDTIYSFTGGANGADPNAALVFGGGKYASDLFGTTPYGGNASCYPSGCGTVFQLKPGTNWTQTVIYSFQGGADGANPVASLAVSKDGILYGTTENGGLTGNGTVFELKPPTSKGGSWTETVLYNFNGTAAATVDISGTTVTQTEGSSFVTGSAWVGMPVSFCIPPPAKDPTEPCTPAGTYTVASVQSATQLTLTESAGSEEGYYLLVQDGTEPVGNLTLLSNGKLYGTTFGGGSNGAGTAFQLTPPTGSGPWTEDVIYNFGGGTQAGQDGAGPEGGFVLSKSDLYGTTYAGTNGGVVFKLSPGKTAWSETILYSFKSYATGYEPYGNLVQDSNGVIYGTTTAGGQDGYGILFSLTAPESGKGQYTLTTIHAFTNGADGGSPYGGLLLGSNGVLYATVTSGCEYGVGGVLEFTPPTGDSSDWTETVLYNFTGLADGGQPFGGVIMGSNNALYGTTSFSDTGYGYGTAFELTQ